MTDEEFEKLSTDEKFEEIRKQLKSILGGTDNAVRNLTGEIDRLEKRMKELERLAKK